MPTVERLIEYLPALLGAAGVLAIGVAVGLGGQEFVAGNIDDWAAELTGPLEGEYETGGFQYDRSCRTRPFLFSKNSCRFGLKRPGMRNALGPRTRSSAAVVGTALLLVLAGCGGTTPAPTETASANAEAPTRPLADHGVNATATWERTIRMTGARASRPSVDVVEVETARGFDVPRYLRVFTNASAPRASAAGGAYVASNHTVVLFERTVAESTPAELESILVHEYGHAIQNRDDRFRRTGSGPSSRGWLVATTLREGMPTYLQKAYERRYLSLPPDRRRSEYETASTAERYTLAPYFYGMRYYDRRADSPDDLPRVIRSPVSTTERILHANRSGTDPLPVDVALNRSAARTRTWGELGTRIVLRDRLDRAAAVRAAAGWNNDTYYEFGPGDDGTVDVVWVHQWDSPAEASQFVNATERHLDRQRAATDTYRYRFRRIAPNRTVLLAGDEAFLDAVTVRISPSGTVRVTGHHGE